MVFSENIKDRLGRYKKENFPDMADGEYRKKKYLHILPKEEVEKNLLPYCRKSSNWIENTFYKILDTHGHHLNSSQVLAFNYFYPLEKNFKYLIEVFKDLGLKIEKSDILSRAEFEYRPNIGENTNIDYYLNYRSGLEIFIEVKYTESSFGQGKINDRMWDSFYSEKVSENINLKVISKENFFKNYQINRNILMSGPNSYVVFIYPRENKSLIKEVEYLRSMNYKNVFLIQWETLLDKTLEKLRENTELYEHYKLFEDKYFSYIK